MIIVKIAGGLGNQLFKLNQALELKDKYHSTFIDLDQFKRDRFDRKYHFQNRLSQVKVINPYLKNGIFKFQKILSALNLFQFYEEHIDDFTIIDKKPISYLSGSWEEEKIPTSKNLNTFRNLFPKVDMKRDNEVCVHFRIKDYSIKLDNEYYMKSLEEFPSNYVFHLFSDDMDYLNSEAKKIFKTKNFEIKDIKDEIIAFSEMMSYKNYISSNSTFSWWSIMLNNHGHLKVTNPKVWMDDYNYKIYRPTNWILI